MRVWNLPSDGSHVVSIIEEPSGIAEISKWVGAPIAIGHRDGFG